MPKLVVKLDNDLSVIHSFADHPLRRLVLSPSFEQVPVSDDKPGGFSPKCISLLSIWSSGISMPSRKCTISAQCPSYTPSTSFTTTGLPNPAGSLYMKRLSSRNCSSSSGSSFAACSISSAVPLCLDNPSVAVGCLPGMSRSSKSNRRIHAIQRVTKAPSRFSWCSRVFALISTTKRTPYSLELSLALCLR